MPGVKAGRKARALHRVADFGDETAVLTGGNRAVATTVPLKNVDCESLAVSQHPEFLEIIRYAA
jgi:hypothetical protein